MQQQQGAAEVPAQRQSTTLAQKADILAGLAMFPALTVMIFLRRKIGYRFLSPTKILIMVLIIWAFSGISAVATGSPSSGLPAGVTGYTASGVAIYGQQSASPLIGAAAPLILFAILMFATGMVKRYLRFKDIKNGVSWHTYSRGISWFSFLPLSDSNIKRYVDPLAVAIAGLLFLWIFRWLGYYILFSAFCLFLFESWDYEQQLNRMLDILDSMVDSEVVSDNVEYYSRDGKAEQRPLEETAGIPTGIAPDIEAQIQKRRRGRQPAPVAMQQSGLYPQQPLAAQNYGAQASQYPPQYPPQTPFPMQEATGQLRRQPPDNLIT